ncbi:MAG: LysM peptidoglycan-binding domain-containing protein [bacterium]
MLKEKYQKVLDLGQKLQVQDGYVEEQGGKLRIGGTAEYAYDKDRLWDMIKEQPGWENEIEADIKVKNQDLYGVYEVVGGDTLSKISKKLFGSANRYMEIFEKNRDILKDPNLIKVGQKLKLPMPS